MIGRVALALVFVLLVACGGGSDSGGESANPGITATAGGGGAAAAAAAAQASPTAAAGADANTPAPVVTIAPMPEPVGFAGVRVALESEFDDPIKAPFLVGTLASGTTTTVADGKYTVTPSAGEPESMLPKAIPSVNDGIIETSVTVTGDGAGGVAIRMRRTPQGTYSGFVCWVAAPDRAGCAISEKDRFENLFTAVPGTVTIGDSNLVRAAMVGDRLQFEVNGVVVGQTTSGFSVAGGWGVYAESAQGGQTAVSFDYIRLYRAPTSFLPQ